MKSKPLFQLFVLLALLLSPLGNSQPARALNQPTVSIDVSSPSIHAGETAIVTVSLTEVPAEGYTSIELTCYYSSDFVEPGDIFIGVLFGADPAVAVSYPYPDRFIVGIAGSQGDKATTDGIVMDFDLIGLEPGQALLECQARVSKGDNVLTKIDSTGGNIIVLGNVLTPTADPDSCDKAQFVADVTVPDGATFSSGASFTKTWRLRNVGSCTWTTSYQLVFFSGEQMGAPLFMNFSMNVAPGQTIDISVHLIAPSSPGYHRGFWMFKNANGALFGIGAQADKPWWVGIRVSGATATSTTTAAMRITIEPGQTTASRIGIVNPNETIQYVLNASAGQVLSITLVAPANEVALGVDGPTGLVLKPLDATLTWNATILTGGDHTITLMALSGSSSKSYTLVVSLTPPAATVTPTFRPTPCDKAELIADLSVPPGTVMSPGEQFIKTWRLKNVGSCSWTPSYRLAFLSGDQMGAPSSIQIPVNVAPGQTIDLSLPMMAPSDTGSHRGYWIFQNSTGQPFGIGSQGNGPWFVDIAVAGGTAAPTGTLPSSVLRLIKSSSSHTYSAPGQTITYTFAITNMGTTALGPAQFIITDNMLSAPYNCGPANITLAPSQSLSCSMNYEITSADMEMPNITNIATAFGAGQASAPATAVVTNLAAPATASPSVTPGVPTATPGPGTVYDFATNACEATWFSGAGQLPCPGADGDPKGFVLKLGNPRLETGATDTRPGLLTFPQNVHNGYIQGFYPPFRVQNGDRFRATIGCEGGATNCYLAFRLDYQVGSESIKTFWGPFLERYEGRTSPVDIDLSRLAGQDVRFILTVLSAGAATGDRALWVGPIIYRANAELTPTSEPITETPGTPATPMFTATITQGPYVTPTPNGSFTPTSTSVPIIGTITGQVLAGKQVIIDLFDADNWPVGVTFANPDGTFSLTAPAGTYNIVARASGFLSAMGPVTVTAGGTTSKPTITLLPGDIDSNFMIDWLDAVTIGINYNTSYPPAADLNNDGTINVLDLELLAQNYRKIGPVDW